MCFRVTLDGSTPGPDSPAYDGPITITEPTRVRARLFDEENRPAGGWKQHYRKKLEWSREFKAR